MEHLVVLVVGGLKMTDLAEIDRIVKAAAENGREGRGSRPKVLVAATHLASARAHLANLTRRLPQCTRMLNTGI